MKKYTEFAKYFITNFPMKPGFGANKNNVIDWPNTINKSFYFFYDDKNYTLIINEYYSDSQKVNVTIKEIDKTSTLYTNTVKDLAFADLLKPNRCSDFKYNIDDIITTNKSRIKILDTKYVKKSNLTFKEYTYRCLTCNYIGTIIEKKLKKKKGCSVCSHSTIATGINDIATTHPEISKLFCNQYEAQNNSYGTNKKFDVKCPNCSYIKNMRPLDILKHGFACPKCGDGKSYPAKFVMSFLDQLGVTYEIEYYPEWLDKGKKRYYDFYIPLNKTIIEVHGLQHYEDRLGFFRPSTIEMENDKYKKNLAISNGIINYIEVNAEQSTCTHLQNSLYNSDLSTIYNLTSIDWNQCDAFASSTILKKACDLWNDGFGTKAICINLHLGRKALRDYLKRGAKLGWCDYSTENHMKESAKRTPRTMLYKKVVCLELLLPFESIKKAAFQTGANPVEIGRCCKNINLTSGNYHWMYYEDFIKYTEEEVLALIKKVPYVINIDTLQTFNTIKEANIYYNSKGNITLCCQGKTKTACGYSWMYYSDYLKLAS